MGRPVDIKLTVLKEEVYSQFSHHGLVSQEAEERGVCRQMALLWFPQEGASEAEEAGWGMASVNNFSGSLGVRLSLVAWYLTWGD